MAHEDRHYPKPERHPPCKLQSDGSHHDPRWMYDCKHCKFNWCCGPTSSCHIRGFSDPPEYRKHEVDAALARAGYFPQYYGIGAQRR